MRVNLLIETKQDMEVFDMLLSRNACTPIPIQDIQEVGRDPLIIEVSKITEEIFEYLKSRNTLFFTFRQGKVQYNPMVREIYSTALGEVTFPVKESEIKTVVGILQVKAAMRVKREKEAKREQELERRRAEKKEAELRAIRQEEAEKLEYANSQAEARVRKYHEHYTGWRKWIPKFLRKLSVS